VAYAGQEYVTVLFDFIQKQRTTCFDYQPFQKAGSERTVFPIFLKEYNHRWFLVGYDRAVQRYQNYALDRIVSRPKLSDWQPQVETLPDAATYFQNLIGVTLEGELAQVVVRVWKPRANYIRTKPWHDSQTEIAETEDWIDFQWQVLLNRELNARILELGADAEVLEPLALREMMGQALERARNRYQK